MTGPRIDATEDWDLARRMLAAEQSWAAIAAATGITMHRLRAALEPGYAEYRRNLSREWAQRNIKDSGSAGRVIALPPPRGEPVSAEDAMRRLAEVPIDTRDFTARMLGDPLPGRSALDAKRAGA